MSVDPSPDILISGAGPVGAFAALRLVSLGFKASSIGILDARSEAASLADGRMIAISDGSRRLLGEEDAWKGCDENPIHRIHVSQRGAFGRTLISRGDYGLDALGYVVRYGALCASLYAELSHRGVSVHRPQRLASVDAGADSVDISVEDGARTSCRYLIHAEGGLFAEQGERPIHRDYEQSAISAWVSASHPIAHQAFERFTADGPIALLPTARAGHAGYTLVWCCRPQDASARMALSDEDFLSALGRAFGGRVGRFTALAARHQSILGLNAVPSVGAGREFAIGNAAQTLHPVAGQGLNLGFRDAYELTQSLQRHFDDPLSCAHEFGAGRRVDRIATVSMTDLLARAFTTPLWPIGLARSLALAAFDLSPPLRGVLAMQMMNGQRASRP